MGAEAEGRDAAPQSLIFPPGLCTHTCHGRGAFGSTDRPPVSLTQPDLPCHHSLLTTSPGFLQQAEATVGPQLGMPSLRGPPLRTPTLTFPLSAFGPAPLAAVPQLLAEVLVTCHKPTRMDRLMHRHVDSLTAPARLGTRPHPIKTYPVTALMSSDVPPLTQSFIP